MSEADLGPKFLADFGCGTGWVAECKSVNIGAGDSGYVGFTDSTLLVFASRGACEDFIQKHGLVDFHAVEHSWSNDMSAAYPKESNFWPANMDPTEYPMRRIRMALGMTLGDLSRASGLSTVAISEIERDERRATNHEWMALGRVFVARMGHRLCEEYASVPYRCGECGAPNFQCENVWGWYCARCTPEGEGT